MTTIVLADDHHVVRQGLRALLEAEADFHIVGEAARLAERLQPDVLVLDLMMPGLSGLDVTWHVSQQSPKTRVVILSMHDNEAYVVEALRNGAAAYVFKNSTADELVQAVRAVAAGRRHLSPPLSEQAIEAQLQKAQLPPPDPYDSLTRREREVLHLVAEGHTSAEIAARLSLSPRTIEMHRSNLMRKLGLRTHTDLIRLALRRGILPLEDEP